MQIGRTPATPRVEALREHAHDLRVLFTCDVPKRRRAPHQRVQIVFAPLLQADLGDDLLGQHVERFVGQRDAIQLAARHAVQQRRALAQLVARQREQATFRRAAHGVAGAADPLQECGNRFGRADLAHQVHIADVDAQLERCGGNQGAQLAALQALFGVQPVLARQAAMVRCHVLRAKPLRQIARRAFGEAPRIHKNQRRPVFGNQRREPVVDQLPDLARHHRLQRRRWQLDRQIAPAHMAGVDDFTIGHAGSVAAVTDQEVRDRLNRLLRGRQADARQRAPREFLETLQRQRQVRAAFVRRHCVNLVDDHGAGAGQHLPPALAREQDVQRFGRRDDDVGETPAHPLALKLRCVSRAHRAADSRLRQAHAFQLGTDPFERYFEVALNVVGERLQRRYVDDARLVGKRPAARNRFAHQRIDRREKRRQRLARAGGRRDQHMPPRLDGGPGINLRGSGRREGGLEPRAHRGVEQIEYG